jgi:hypothetical protein
MKACCTGCSLARVPQAFERGDLAPGTPRAGITQARAAMPSTSTVQAPHSPRPQPYFGPFSAGRCAAPVSSDARPAPPRYGAPVDH